MVCSALAGRRIEDVIKIKRTAEGQLACVGAGACTARMRVVSRMPETRSALAAEMASLGRASDVNIRPHLDIDRVSSPVQMGHHRVTAANSAFASATVSSSLHIQYVFILSNSPFQGCCASARTIPAYAIDLKQVKYELK